MTIRQVAASPLIMESARCLSSVIFAKADRETEEIAKVNVIVIDNIILREALKSPAAAGPSIADTKYISES
jgi:hypothetical protein